jgi:hypothetical protein
MNGEAVLAESFRQHFHHPLGILFPCEHKYRVVREPDQERIPFQARLHLICKPSVQHIVQVDVA